MSDVARQLDRSARRLGAVSPRRWLSILVVAFLIGLSPQGWSDASATDLETETIRLGGDYGTVMVGDATACAAACEKDPRCLSFTFIVDSSNQSGQCRLKNTVAPSYTNRCCTSGVSQAGQAALARLPSDGRRGQWRRRRLRCLGRRHAGMSALRLDGFGTAGDQHTIRVWQRRNAVE